MIAKLITSNIPEPVSLLKTGSDILYHLDENKLNDIPVVENGNLIGSIVEADIYTLKDPDIALGKQTVNLKRDFVYDYHHLMEVIKVFAESKLSVLPVLDENDIYIGCVVREKLIQEVARMLAVGNPGAFIVVELNQNDYVLSQIAQIVESQDSKILNLFVPDSKDSTKTDVIIKVNTMEIQALLQTFNRYNYIIKATYTEDEKMHDDLRERYDSLMRYLNI